MSTTHEAPTPTPAAPAAGKPGKPVVQRANGTHVELPTVTNAAFLKAIFGPEYRHAHVACFEDPPDAIDPERRGLCWAGRHFGEHGPSTTHNCYFTISIFNDLVEEDGKTRHVRRKAQFRSGHCVVVDDVNTKVDTNDPRLPAPSWKLETSPDNFQWGYILAEPCTDQQLFSGLLAGMVAAGLAVDGTDPGMKGCTRYVRLPQGRNLKTKLMPAGFTCRMHEWAPTRRYTIEQPGQRFGLSLDDMRSQGEAGHTERGREVLASEDPLLKALADLYIAPGTDGWHHIVCPWSGDHSTDDTSGTGVWVGPDRYGFQCHHGHCTKRQIGDLYRWMREQGMEVPDVGVEGAFENLTGEDDAATPVDRTAPPVADPVALQWGDFPEFPPDVEFVIPRWLPYDALTLFAAHGGTGKSYLSLFIALCLATGRNPFEPGLSIPRVKVLLYSAEDNMKVLHARLWRYVRLMGIKPADLESWLLILDATQSDNVLFTEGEKVGARTTARFKWLHKQVKAFDAPVLIFDNASDAADINENNRAITRQFLSAMCRLARVVLLLAHVDAISSMADVGDAKGYSGNTGWHNKARSRWFMGTDKATDTILLTLPKANYSKAGAQALVKWNDAHGVWEIAGTSEGNTKAADHRDVLLTLLAKAIALGAAVSPAMNTSTSVWNSIKHMEGCPGGLKPADVFKEVMRWRVEGLVTIETKERSNRTKQDVLVLTDKGRNLCRGTA